MLWLVNSFIPMQEMIKRTVKLILDILTLGIAISVFVD